MPIIEKLQRYNNVLKEYFRSILGPLKPIVDHGFKAVYIAIIVRLVSVALHFIVPTNVIDFIEILELGFYVVISGALCLYTFIVFCWNLIRHLWEELSVDVKKTRNRIARRVIELDTHSPIRQLTEGNQNDYVNTEGVHVRETHRVEQERRHNSETK